MSSIIPPDYNKEIFNIFDKYDLLKNFFSVSENITDENGFYIHWNDIYLSANNIDEKEMIQKWLRLKFKRSQIYREFPIYHFEKKSFKYILTPKIEKKLYFLDFHTSGNLSSQQPILEFHLKNSYLTHALVDEAIYSSTLEGCSITREDAKKLIHAELEPKTKDENLVLNHYEAMLYIKENIESPLSKEFLKDLHKILLKNIISDDKLGKFRVEEDGSFIVMGNDEDIFIAPDAKNIEEQISLLCSFANKICETNSFIHPIIKAIMLLFFSSHIHPFVELNGSISRALFFWYLLKNGYWLSEFISISKIIQQNPVNYTLPFLYTQTDDNDATYFIEGILDILLESIEDLQYHFQTELKDIEIFKTLFSSKDNAEKLNFRQHKILSHAVKNPGYIYTITEYKNLNGVVYDTARKDLLELSDKFKLLLKTKSAKSFIFISPSDLKKRLSKFS
ncbi:Fic family protein [bacterium]|nr:Fic family protein [bacterium]